MLNRSARLFCSCPVLSFCGGRRFVLSHIGGELERKHTPQSANIRRRGLQTRPYGPETNLRFLAWDSPSVRISRFAQPKSADASNASRISAVSSPASTSRSTSYFCGFRWAWERRDDSFTMALWRASMSAFSPNSKRLAITSSVLVSSLNLSA